MKKQIGNWNIDVVQLGKITSVLTGLVRLRGKVITNLMQVVLLTHTRQCDTDAFLTQCSQVSSLFGISTFGNDSAPRALYITEFTLYTVPVKHPRGYIEVAKTFTTGTVLHSQS